MPASSRLTDLFGISSPLRRATNLLRLDAESGGWADIAANGMWGGHLTATADPAAARVRVDLYWPRIREATVERVHPDGSTYEVRGGDPATMCTGWARWDYEAPLDTAVYYQATSDERDGLVVTTAPLTLASSTEAWLTHPMQPSLNLLVTIRSLEQRDRQAQRGVLRSPLRSTPITVNGVRGAPAGTIVLATTDADERDALDALVDDGSDLLLRLPQSWGGHTWYVSLTRVAPTRLEPLLGTLIYEHVGLAYEVVDRPDGTADGADGNQYSDVGDTYDTYLGLAPVYSTYLDLSMAEL